MLTKYWLTKLTFYINLPIYGLLWSGCRHHVREIILAQIFKDLKIETSKSPHVSVFLRLRKHFDVLSIPTHSEMIDISSLMVDKEVAPNIAQ